jgi:hypothetical protein
VPTGKEDVLMLNAVILIVNDRMALAEDDAASVTRTPKLDDPVRVGVPEIVPPASVKPGGSEPLAIDQV